MQRYCKLGEMQNKLELFLILGKKKEIPSVEISFFQLGYPDNKALNPIDFYLIQMFVNL